MKMKCVYALNKKKYLPVGSEKLVFSKNSLNFDPFFRKQNLT